MAEMQSLRFTAVGASDIVGVGARNPSTENWASVLHGFMPHGAQFTRLGRGGITLRDANEQEVPEAVASRPDIVTMWNCANDAVKQVPLDLYRQQLEVALSALTSGTEASIFVLNLPDLSLVLNEQVSQSQRALIRGGIELWNSMIAATAAQYRDRVFIVDLFAATSEVIAHPEYVSLDHFHPSTEGYRRIAEIVWARINESGILGSTFSGLKESA